MIRKAVISDAKAVCDVLVESITRLCVADHNNDRGLLSGWLANKTVENCEHWIASDKTITLVTEIDSIIGGVADLGNDGHLYLFYVSPRCFNSGHGSEFLNVVNSQAISLGLKELSLGSTKTAYGFLYETRFRCSR